MKNNTSYITDREIKDNLTDNDWLLLENDASELFITGDLHCSIDIKTIKQEFFRQ